jgi:hypothetical protein
MVVAQHIRVVFQLANSVCGLKGIRVLSLSSGVSSVFTRDAE